MHFEVSVSRFTPAFMPYIEVITSTPCQLPAHENTSSWTTSPPNTFKPQFEGGVPSQSHPKINPKHKLPPKHMNTSQRRENRQFTSFPGPTHTPLYITGVQGPLVTLTTSHRSHASCTSTLPQHSTPSPPQHPGPGLPYMPALSSAQQSASGSDLQLLWDSYLLVTVQLPDFQSRTLDAVSSRKHPSTDVCK